MTDPTDVVARLRAMHKPRTERPGSCCVQCGIVWPCPTSRVLDETAPAAVPPAPADRGAEIRAHAFKTAALYVRGHSADKRFDKCSVSTALCTVSDELRRMAAEAPQPGRPDVGTEFVQQVDQLDSAALDAVDAELADETEPCGAWGGCTLARGHNIGQADIPENHRPSAVGAQQPEADDCCGVLPPELFIDDAGREWHAGDCWCTLAPGHGGQHRCQPCTDRVGAPGWTDHAAVEAQQPETQAENPARIDRLRPEFTDHASVESIDAQLQRARSQLRRWHLRVEWLISLRQARLEQKERGEWPAAVAQSVEVRQADTAGEQQ